MLRFIKEVSLVGIKIDEVDMVQNLGDAADQSDARRLLAIYQGKLQEIDKTLTAKLPPFQKE